MVKLFRRMHRYESVTLQPYRIKLIKSEILRNALSASLDKMASVTTEPHTRRAQSMTAALLMQQLLHACPHRQRFCCGLLQAALHLSRNQSECNAGLHNEMKLGVLFVLQTHRTYTEAIQFRTE